MSRSEMARSERRESVEVLRGIAAFSVMWFHLTNGNSGFLPSDSALKASGAYGFVGVQMFFVISGFIIPYSLALRNYTIARDGLGFLVRRIVRIDPAYIVSALLMILLQAASAITPGSRAEWPGSGVAASLALHLFYLAPWFGAPWLSPVYWSLAIEFQYYIVMLFCAPLLLSPRRAHGHAVLLVTALLPFAASDTRTLLPFMPLFGLGFVRFLAARRHFGLAEVLAWGIVFSGVCYVEMGFPQALAAAFAFGVLFLPLGRPVPILSFLGMISYSLYLIHVPIGGRVINLAARLPLTPALRLASLCLAVLLSIAAAYGFWLLVERPSMRLSRSIGAKSKPVAHSPIAPPA